MATITTETEPVTELVAAKSTPDRDADPVQAGPVQQETILAALQPDALRSSTTVLGMATTQETLTHAALNGGNAPEVVAPDMNSVRMTPDGAAHNAATEYDEFDYHPIPVLAPLSLIVGLCSLASLAAVPGLLVPLLGLIVGGLGYWQITRSKGEYGGFRLNLTGIVLSSLWLIAGTSFHAYTYATEVPEGYERLSFRWLSQQAPITEDGKLRIADEAKAIDGQKVFVKGYMYPGQQKEGIQQFVLCKDTGQCCFGGKPAITDIIFVNFVNDTRADFRELQLVSVAGTFRAKKVGTGSDVSFLYQLEGEYFK